MKKLTRIIKGFVFIALVNITYADTPLTPIQYVRGEPVFSSPYLGERSDFESFDLIINISDVDQSLRLLEQMQDAEKRLKKRGYTMPSQPTIDLSGSIIVSATVDQEFGKSKYNESFALDEVELDVFTRINEWAMAFFEISYSSSAIPNPQETLGVSNRKLDNSRFYLKQGFITLGNLNRFPLYVVGGQIFVPFGTKSTSLVSGPFTGGLTDTKQRALLIGFKHGNSMLNYNAAVYGFNSSYRGGKNDGGAKIGINFSKSGFSASVSGGVISNIFEAEIFQNNGDTFSGFAIFDEKEKPQSRKIGLTAFASIGYKNVTLQGEFFTVGSALPKEFFSNGDGGRVKPRAFHVEMASENKFHTIPSLFAIGYGESAKAQSLEQAKRKIYASVTIEPIKSTLFGIEYSRTRDYAKGSKAKTWGYDSTTEKGALVDVTGTGDWKNAINIFFGYFF